MSFNDLDLERAILSTCLLNEGYESVAGELNEDDFTLAAHREIFKAMKACTNAGQPVSVSFLRKHARLDEAALAELLATPSLSEPGPYVSELREKSIKRQLLAFAKSLPARIDEVRPVSVITDELSRELFRLTNRVNMSDIKHISQSIRELLEDFARKKALKNKEIVGLDTGFKLLNFSTQGFKGGELIILAARPGMGKTTLAINLVERVLQGDRGVVVFSLEMPASQILQRLISSKTSIPLQRLIKGDINDDEWDRICDLLNENYVGKDFYIYDSGYATITDIRSILRRLKTQHAELGLCVIDYIGLMGSNSSYADRHLQVSEISRGLKLLARELDIPIIALSQLNRAVSTRSNKRPIMSDLRESGAIEQDADLILFIYREEQSRAEEGKANQDRLNQPQEPAEIIIGKNRNGPTGVIEVIFDKEHSRFIDRPRQEYP